MDSMIELEDFLSIGPDEVGMDDLEASEDYDDTPQTGPQDISLDDLLAESLLTISQDKEFKEAKKKLTRGCPSAEEYLATKALVAKWELARHWTPVACTIIFQVQHCTTCGASHHHFAGYFQHQSHRTSQIDRWMAIDKSQSMVSPLPKEIKEEQTNVDMCMECCCELGWGA